MQQRKDKFLSFAQVAQIIGLAEATIRKGKCGTDEIPRVRVGRRVMFSTLAVESWMNRKVREAEEIKRRQREEAMTGDRQRRWLRLAVQRRLTVKRRGDSNEH